MVLKGLEKETGGIVTFLLLIFFKTMSSSLFINSSSLMSSWPLMIYLSGLSMISRFPSRFLKCSFHSWFFSSWLAVLSFALEVLFFSVNFIYFLWLFIFNRISDFIHFTYNVLSSCSFWYVFVSSLWTLSFWILVFVGFLLSSKDKFLQFRIIIFLQIAFDSQGTLYLALDLVGMHSDTHNENFI